MIKDVRVTGLWIYPIKSCQGISVDEIQIVKTGPQFDRQFMIVDQMNQVLTLRTDKKLAGIRTVIQDDILEISFLLSKTNQKINLNLKKNSKIIQEITLWDSTLLAGVESDEVNLALSQYLEKSVKLLRYQSESFRDMGLYKTSSVQETMFTDANPILLTNEDSLKNINQKLESQNFEPSNMNRFRANIIISGLEAYGEDKIKSLQIGDVVFSKPKLCSRCVIVNMDENSGDIVSKETLKNLPLHKFEKGPKIIFGQYLTPENLGVIYKGAVCKVQFD